MALLLLPPALLGEQAVTGVLPQLQCLCLAVWDKPGVCVLRQGQQLAPRNMSWGSGVLLGYGSKPSSSGYTLAVTAVLC